MQVEKKPSPRVFLPYQLIINVEYQSDENALLNFKSNTWDSHTINVFNQLENTIKCQD